MKITVLNSSVDHPINAWLSDWKAKHEDTHEIEIVRSKSELSGGELLFLISCVEIIGAQDRAKYAKTLVIHASDLPIGRGWSPHVWQVVSGETELTVTLLEATDKVDAGDIWHKLKIHVPPTALYDEINQGIFQTEIDLMDFAVANFTTIEPKPQDSIEPTYWPKRSPKDSELDTSKSINELFNLIRVCDPNRFPAYFIKDGRKYVLKVEADNER